MATYYCGTADCALLCNGWGSMSGTDASAIIAAREQAAAAKQGNTPARLVLDAVSEGAGE